MTTRTILFVEDEIMIALPMEMALQDAGCEVVHTLTGTQAIAELERRARDFTVLVTDIKLPGANGWEVARKARELHPRIGVVYASGDSGADWQTGGLPGSIFLQKPYTSDDLIRAAARAAWD
jgi:CheY-like chemotaxis protein